MELKVRLPAGLAERVRVAAAAMSAASTVR